jgi:hypothetical protein
MGDLVSVGTTKQSASETNQRQILRFIGCKILQVGSQGSPIISGRKSGAEMARPYNVCAPTVLRIVAQFRTSPA